VTVPGPQVMKRKIMAIEPIISGNESKWPWAHLLLSFFRYIPMHLDIFKVFLFTNWWYISMENLWNDIDREHKSIWINNVSHCHFVHHKSHNGCDQTQASNVRSQPLTVRVLWISPVTHSKSQENRLVLTTFCFHRLFKSLCLENNLEMKW
jgi:hypothetical protein